MTNSTVRQRVREWLDWLSGKKKPKPPVPPVSPDVKPVPPNVKPTVNPPRQPNILELIQFFRNFKIKEYLPALISVPVLVFLAISGVVMWVVTILKFLASLIRTIFHP